MTSIEGAKILVVDNEPHNLELVRFHLEASGFVVIEVLDGRRAVDMALLHNPALVLLDLLLPGLDGIEIIKLLRRHEAIRDIPIIILTAKNEEEDKVLAFEIGADDYITKPFSPKELVVRVRAVLRRAAVYDEDKNCFIIGNLTIDADKHEVLISGEKQEFPPKEFELLKLLAKNPDRVFSREYLLENIWGYDYLGDTRTVDVHMHHLRQKIQNGDDKQVFIETVRGIGYKLNIVK